MSAVPTLELPDTVLFPDENLTLTVSRTDPLLQLIAQADALVPQGDEPPIPIVKFRPAVVGQDDRPPTTVVRLHPGRAGRAKTTGCPARSARSARSPSTHGPMVT